MTAPEKARFIALELDRGNLSVLSEYAGFIAAHRSEIWSLRAAQQAKAKARDRDKAVAPPEPGDERDEDLLYPDLPCECPCRECRNDDCEHCSNPECDDLQCVHGDDEDEGEKDDDFDEPDDDRRRQNDDDEEG